MARDWETQFAAWARPPTVAETEKMERTEREIRAAIDASAKLAPHKPRVYPQGSYYNRTNVPRESDVDVRVVPNDVFFPDWELVDPRAPYTREVREALDRQIGAPPSPYTFEQFRDEVGEALVDRFGPPPAVKPGDKAYSIHETRLMVESDCLPAYEVRLYSRAGSSFTHAAGIEFETRAGRRIQNYPEQQHRNGIAKHDRTGQRFKKMVRCFKNLRNEMEDEGIAAAKPIPSFFSECLVWNVPDHLFPAGSFYTGMRLVLASLYVDTEDEAKSGKWLEENGIKFLFHPSQSWTRQKAHDFVSAAWSYVGYS